MEIIGLLQFPNSKKKEKMNVFKKDIDNA